MAEFMYTILNVCTRNLDVFFVNLSVFCFGFSIFSFAKNRIKEAKKLTTPSLRSVGYFYYKENRQEIPLDSREIDDSKTIMCGMYAGEEHFPVTKEEYLQYRAYDDYNSAYETLIANNNQSICISRIGALLVIISTVISLVADSSLLFGLLASIVYILCGSLFLWLVITVARKLHPMRAQPERPRFKNRLAK